MDQARLAVADGIFEVGKAVIENADPPDASPYGEGLPQQGGVLAYIDGKKVNGWSLQGNQPKPPRAARISRTRGTVILVGWGFPARFNETGTVEMAAQPFFTPSADEIVTPASATRIMAPVVSGRLR
jgi:hypothetical protein